MKKLLLAISVLAMVAGCGGSSSAPTNPEIVAKLQKIEPNMPLADVEEMLGDPVAFTIAPDRQSHCKAYLYHNEGSDRDKYVIVYYVKNLVFSVESDKSRTECTATTEPKNTREVEVARPVS